MNTNALCTDETGKKIVDALTFKYADAISAVQAKGEEVLASIPEDYIELLETVNTHSTKINDILKELETLEEVIDDINGEDI